MIQQGSTIKTEDDVVYNVGPEIDAGGISTIYRAFPQQRSQPLAVVKVFNERENDAFDLELKVLTTLRQRLRDLSVPWVKTISSVNGQEQSGQSALVLEYMDPKSRLSYLCGSQEPPGESELLEAAACYAVLLRILHTDEELKYTCNDRKGRDLYWLPVSKGNRLVVLDWNTVKPCEPEDAHKDLYNFGYIWYVFLAKGNPPPRIPDPQAKYPRGWTELSFGTRYILWRLLKAGYKGGYSQADEAYVDLCWYYERLTQGVDDWISEAQAIKQKAEEANAEDSDRLHVQMLMGLVERSGETRAKKTDLEDIRAWLSDPVAASRERWSDIERRVQKDIGLGMYPNALSYIQSLTPEALPQEVEQLERLSLVLRVLEAVDSSKAIEQRKHEYYNNQASKIIAWEWSAISPSERKDSIRRLVEELEADTQNKAANVLQALLLHTEIEELEDNESDLLQHRDYLKKVYDLVQKTARLDKGYGAWLSSCYPHLDSEIVRIEREVETEQWHKAREEQVAEFLSQLTERIGEAVSSGLAQWPIIEPKQFAKTDERVKSWMLIKSLLENEKFCHARQELDQVGSSKLHLLAFELWSKLASQWLYTLQERDSVGPVSLREARDLLNQYRVEVDTDLQKWLGVRTKFLQSEEIQATRDRIIGKGPLTNLDNDDSLIDQTLKQALDLQVEVFEMPLTVSGVLAIRSVERLRSLLERIHQDLSNLRNQMSDLEAWAKEQGSAKGLKSLRKSVDRVNSTVAEMLGLKQDIESSIAEIERFSRESSKLDDQLAQLGQWSRTLHALQGLAALLELQPTEYEAQQAEGSDQPFEATVLEQAVQNETALLQDPQTLETLRNWRKALNDSDADEANKQWRSWSSVPSSTRSWLGAYLALRHLYEMKPYEVKDKRLQALDVSHLRKLLRDRRLDDLENYLQKVDTSKLTEIEVEIYNSWWRRLDQAYTLKEAIEATEAYTSKKFTDDSLGTVGRAEIQFHQSVMNMPPEVLYPYQDECEQAYRQYNSLMYGSDIETGKLALNRRITSLNRRCERGRIFFEE